jgi:PAS domain S-box-containing protein
MPRRSPHVVFIRESTTPAPQLSKSMSNHPSPPPPIPTNPGGKSSLSGMSEQDRYQLLVAAVSDYAIYMLDLNGYVSSWNAGAQRFKGYKPHEIIGQHFSRFYTEEDRAAGVPQRALRTAIEEGKFEAEGWRVRKDGTRFWASIVIDPIRNHSGELIGFAKITRDMTEKKAAQEALRASEERFRLLVQGVTDYAIYMLSPTGLVSNWNIGAERIKGYAQHEVIGTHFSRFYTEEDRHKEIPLFALETASSTGRFEAEGWRVRKDGTRFWAHVVIDAIRDEQGKLLGFAKVTRDITERKQTAEALERANAALFQAQKMEAIGKLTGGIAHDFNNLLAVLSSSIDMFATRQLKPEEAHLLETMQRTVERGATLTRQLLAFARQQPLKVEVLDINSLIGGFEAMLRRAGNSSIRFEFALAPRLKPVSLDAARFEAALLNLVVNARDAMPDGGVLTVSTANVELGERELGNLGAGAYVRVGVKDTGSGMTPEVLSRAFEPFFTTKEIGRGTGLGLSQVYGFITQSGGNVLLQSEPGAGTAVDIYLPVCTSAGDAAQRRDAADADIETVLIVEDEPDLIDVAAALFRSMGYEVLTAGNAKDALTILERKPDTDVLFTDVMMPGGMNGIELARIARKRCPDLKIMLASGYALPALKTTHGNIEEFAFINKPYRLSDLAKKLRSFG